MKEYYDRYKKFRTDGLVSNVVPFIPIAKTTSDITIIFDSSKMRFDNLSYKYYNDANYGWLILQANPDIPSFEYEIENGTPIRIPYPLETAITRYEKAIEEYKNTH